jgi:hypothetical protein
MGMYTEIFVTGSTSDPTTAEWLRFMMGLRGEDEPGPRPDHPLFATERWDFMLQCSSYYFPVSESQASFRWDEIAKSWQFTSLSSFKNYGGEADLFFDWLKSAGAEFFGYHRYEETPDQPHFFCSPAPEEEN